jgi:hypothetical protein
LFQINWDFPSVEPPDYLRQLHPEIYEQQCRRMRQRFDEAVQLAEQAFLEELGQLVAHLTERLTGQADGKPKIISRQRDRESDRILSAVPEAERAQ